MSSSPPHESVPLAGKRVVLACSERTAEKLRPPLESMGAQVRYIPVIVTRAIEDREPVDRAIRSLETYDWILFTSSYGVEYFLRRMDDLDVPRRQRLERSVAAVGPSTAATLRRHGIAVTLVPEDYVAEGVLEALARHHGGTEQLSGLRFLLPRAKEARDVLPRELGKAGANVDVVPCYETVQAGPDPAVRAALERQPPDLLVFSSSSTVHGFLGLVGAEAGRDFMARAKVAAIGPITARTLASHGKNADILPRENSADSLLAAIRDHYVTAGRG